MSDYPYAKSEEMWKKDAHIGSHVETAVYHDPPATPGRQTARISG
jgi:hypothetical protein